MNCIKICSKRVLHSCYAPVAIMHCINKRFISQLAAGRPTCCIATAHHHAAACPRSRLQCLLPAEADGSGGGLFPGSFVRIRVAPDPSDTCHKTELCRVCFTIHIHASVFYIYSHHPPAGLAAMHNMRCMPSLVPNIIITSTIT